MPNKKLITDESVNAAREQAKITANDIVRSIQEPTKSGYISYPELIAILRHSLLQAINEMVNHRFGLPEISLKNLGLNKLHAELEALARRKE